MDNILRRQIEAWCNLRHSRSLFVSLCLHDVVARLTQLYACGGVYGIVDAAMQWDEAAEELAVGGIDDGINLQPRDVALPNLQAIAFGFHDTLILQLTLQLTVLPLEEISGGRLGLSYIHQHTHQYLLVHEIIRDLKAGAGVGHQLRDDGIKVTEPLGCIFLRHIRLLLCCW